MSHWATEVKKQCTFVHFPIFAALDPPFLCSGHALSTFGCSFGFRTVLVETADHKAARWENGCRSTQPRVGESGEGVQEDRNACNDQKDPSSAEKWKVQERRLKPPAGDPPRYETCDSSGRNNEKKRRSQNRKHSPHRPSYLALHQSEK
jgi:hypothetical protein